MKYLSTLFLSTLFIVSCSFSQEKPTAEKFVKNIDVATFKELTDKGDGIILDVRTLDEIAGGTIPNASTINFYDADFERKIKLMQKDKAIYVYCLSGGRSAQAAQLLAKNGFDRVYNLEGGITAWKRQNFPLTEPTTAKDENIKTFSLADFNTLIQQNDVVLVDFHTIWCAPCKKMSPVIDEIEQEYKGKAVIQRIDIDKSTDVGTAFNISGVPVFSIFVKGEQKWTHNGVISKEKLLAELEKYLK